MRRSYDQYCGLAGALDLVGERWTLLVVRELMTGPKRYTDLIESLPGIGTSLLASRLKQLEADGICARAYLPPPAASTVYQLTDAGEELGHSLMPLIRWGLRHAVPEQPGPDTLIGPEWVLLGFTHQLDPKTLGGIDGTYRFVVQGHPAWLQIRDGRANLVPEGADRRPDATVTLDAATVAAIGSGRTSATDAVLAGKVSIEGDQAAIDDLIRVFATVG
jgi:DNA-binding HxlR family transcriptional regulator